MRLKMESQWRTRENEKLSDMNYFEVLLDSISLNKADLLLFDNERVFINPDNQSNTSNNYD